MTSQDLWELAEFIYKLEILDSRDTRTNWNRLPKSDKDTYYEMALSFVMNCNNSLTMKIDTPDIARLAWSIFIK